MDISEVVQKISLESNPGIVDRLVDILLKSKGANKVPSELVRDFLHYWRKDRLADKDGVTILLEAASKMDADATSKELAEAGFSEAAEALTRALKAE